MFDKLNVQLRLLEYINLMYKVSVFKLGPLYNYNIMSSWRQTIGGKQKAELFHLQ